MTAEEMAARAAVLAAAASKRAMIERDVDPAGMALDLMAMARRLHELGLRDQAAELERHAVYWDTRARQPK